jgi:tyrosyl-tRNA synthetase
MSCLDNLIRLCDRVISIMSLSHELIERGFINQFSSPTLEEVVDGEKRTIYHGIDPSADSAHAGNFVIWVLLRHLANAGHKIIFLVGGATGMVGDPKPDAERQLKSFEDIDANVQKIKIQAENFFKGYEIEFVNNFDWFKDLSLLDFLRDVGKHYTVNELVKKDAIATRLQSDTGLSYTEFAYPLIQGYDFYKLNKEKNCTVQVGGSDQWGNMISGVELVRRKSQKEVFVVTVPLIVDKATGKKFGKSEGNAVWIDTKKTSPYHFYQFWFNVSDENVIDYLKLFTFLPLEEIEEIKRETESNPGKRKAQQILAKEVTSLVHGDDYSDSAKNVSGILFGDVSLDNVSESEKKMLIENAPTTVVKKGSLLIDILVDTGLATSKREAKTFVEGGAVSINSEQIFDLETVISDPHFISGLALLKRGKKNLNLLTL